MAKFAVAVTIAAPGWSAAIDDAEISHWQRASGTEAKALSFLIEAVWSEGEAKERGIVVTAADARDAVDEKPHDGLTRDDLLYAARAQLQTARIRDQITQPAALGVTPEQIDAYVLAHPRQEPERRATRVLSAPSRAKARAALRALQGKLTWRGAARRYSTNRGGSGAPRTLERGMLPERVENAIFNAPEGALTRYGTYVFEVTRIAPGGPTPLAQQRATAWEILSSEAQAAALSVFSAEFRSRWRSRTVCAPAFATHADCGNPPTVK